MAYSSSHIPRKLVIDKSPNSVQPDEAVYLLNHEINNAGTQGESNPHPANYPAGDIEKPAGETYSVGSIKDEITNEAYSWQYNSNGVHYIQRLSDEHGLQVVYDKPCLELSADPQHSIEPCRAILRLEEVYNKNGVSCKNRAGKELIWTDGKYPIGCIDVEASIATNGFTTAFFDICPDPCAMIQLCVPEPFGAITAEFIPRTPQDVGLTNKLLQKGFKFRFRHIYYDLRASEWSDISTLYYLDDNGCFQTPDALSRCMKLTIPMGNPMVERIELAFSVGDKGDLVSTDGFNDIWLLYTTIDKYKKYNNNQQKWYERWLSDDLVFDLTNCTFEYAFCNDKECNPIDFKETSRVYNPLPNQPQGILRVKENNFGFYNYVQGNCPVDKIEIDKFKINVACAEDECHSQIAFVKVRAVLLDPLEGYNQFVYRLGGSVGDTDDTTEPAYYGAAPYYENIFTRPVRFMCGQKFNGSRNFTAYIEGTGYFVEMKQMSARNGFVNTQEYGIVSGMGVEEIEASTPIFTVWEGGYFYQEAIFKVAKGTRGIIRLKAHSSKINDSDSSENIFGTVPLVSLSSNNGILNWSSILTGNVVEIPFDTCIGDVELNDAFLIKSIGFDGLGITGANSFYLYEGYLTDADGDPVQGAKIMTGGIFINAVTDHNGYYGFYSGNDSTATIEFKVEKDCSKFITVETRVVDGVVNGVAAADVEISDIYYKDSFFYTLKVSVLDCDMQPVKGVTIALTEGKSKPTSVDNGEAVFKIRNKYTRDKIVRAYVMDSKGCFTVGCNGECGPCMPQTELIPLDDCFASNPQGSIVMADKLNIAAIAINRASLKRGGRYPFGLVVQGDCGKLSSVYELPYIDIPKVQATNTNSGCALSFDATGITFPLWANCLKIVRGSNINPYELQWVVDSFEKTGDNKIKITIQSLNDYNEQYFFKTNTVYQWLKGDRVEFVKDENGGIIPASTNGLLNYLTLSPFHDTLISGRTEVDANYFNQLIIEDDGKLDFLKAGALIEIQRAKECTTEPIYFQVTSIPIVNGKLAYESGSFSTFDTYTIKRIINGGALQSFEHHSPSDFWGTKLSDVGKVFFTNIYENERRFGRNISINAVGQFNYFGDLVKTMPATQQGDIIGMWISDGRIILAVCENDNFVAESADDLLRVGNDGVIIALPTDAIIGNPNPKLSGQYGCRYSDIGSLYFGDGYATWYDGRNYCYVKHDYNFARAVDYEKVQTYFRTVGTKMDLVNKTAEDLDKIRFSTGFNYTTGAVIVTNKSLRHSGFNNDKKLYDSPNTTILFNPATEDFLTMVGYTGERYSHVTLNDGFGCAFLAYLNGIPYIHPVIPEKYNEFFGVPTDRVITVVINKYPEKERIPLAMEVQSDTRYFVSNVETSDPSFRSEIPPVKVKPFGKKWNAGFLRNINSVGGLFNGKEANDFYIKVTLVRDNTDALKYGTIDNQKRTKFDSLSMILFRFQLSEQSGFTEQK